MLEVIYVVRHGYRSNWAVDPQTGTYTSSVRTPTGIAADPALASYGVLQSQQLATHLATLEPPAEALYSSPYYRCLQTLQPFVAKLAEGTVSGSAKLNGKPSVTVEPGLGEFYGTAKFTHPSPAGLEELKKHFDHLRAEDQAIVVPAPNGETIPALHDRVAHCLAELIDRADRDPNGPKAILLCSHAAAIIAMGRVLTGRMPEDIGEEDFRCFTCGVSQFVRRGEAAGGGSKWSAQHPEDVQWRDGKGVGGGWECVRNSDCSFLENGEERGWNFYMETQRLERLEKEAAEAAAKTVADSDATAAHSGNI